MTYIDAYDLFLDFCSRVNTFQGGNFRLQSDFIRNVNNIYSSIVNREIRNAPKSQESKDNVLAFHISKNIIIPRSIFHSYAIMPLPKDYFRFSSCRLITSRQEDVIITIPDVNINKGTCFDGRKNNVVYAIDKPQDPKKSIITEYTIELINDKQWAGCLSHLTKYPSLTPGTKGGGPKMLQTNGTFQIAPKEIGVVVFSYYKEPEPAILNVTYTPGDDQTGAGDEVIYNKVGSTPLLLPISMKDEFLWRLGEIYGYFTREQFMAAFGNQKTKD